jgi:hypothetical protein
MIIQLHNWVIQNGRKCGYLKDGYYVREVIPERHYYVLGGGYPVSNDILKWLSIRGIKKLRFIEKGRKATRTYECGVEDYLKAVMIQHPPFEQQRVIPLKLLREVK